MSILFTFPGQGAQTPDMLKSLPCHTAISATLAEASEVLGQDVRLLDSAAALRSTLAVQLCLLIAGVATVRWLEQQDCRPDMVAGLSIGAYPAAVAAGALSFPQALRRVALRGRLMENAYPSGFGMLAVLGLSPQQMEPVLEALRAQAQPVYLANINAPTQLVVAGSKTGLQAVSAVAMAAGAHKTRLLSISVPSHCPLLQAPADELAAAFADEPLHTPRIAYLSASCARVLWQPAQIRDDLAHNMARQVRWHETAALASERGARLAVEMPPGNVLTRLVKPVFKSGLAIAASEMRMDSLISFCRRENSQTGIYGGNDHSEFD